MHPLLKQCEQIRCNLPQSCTLVTSSLGTGINWSTCKWVTCKFPKKVSFIFFLSESFISGWFNYLFFNSATIAHSLSASLTAVAQALGNWAGNRMGSGPENSSSAYFSTDARIQKAPRETESTNLCSHKARQQLAVQLSALHARIDVLTVTLLRQLGEIWGWRSQMKGQIIVTGRIWSLCDVSECILSPLTILFVYCWCVWSVFSCAGYR